MVDDTKIVSVKSTLCSPYSVEWPLLEKGETPAILNAIQRTFEPLKRKLGKVKSRGRKFHQHSTTVEVDSQVLVQEKPRQDQGLRSQILVGVNEVTRALERGLLRSVVVCRSTKPSHMTNHLLTLSATRETPALCLFKLSEVLSPLLNLKTVMAIGFKKTNEEESVFDDLVELLIRKTPALNLPWLKQSKINLDNFKRDHPRLVDDIHESEQDDVIDFDTVEETPKTEEESMDVGKCRLKATTEKQPLVGVKRPIDEMSNEEGGNKQLKLSGSPTKAEYIDVRIDKVKVIPKELKSKRRKKKKKKAKTF